MDGGSERITVSRGRSPATPNHEARLASFGNMALGSWLLVGGPFLSAHASVGAAVRTEVIAGALVLALATLRASSPDRARWADLVMASTGVGLMVAPLVLGHADVATAVLNEMVVGLAIVVLAIEAHSLSEPS